ncbi:hypothetical protein [Gimesia sp.]|uniref:hypothetical protein n=1 Tax=Gimesia sp. TaxID=2024833 RepID=UPI000C53CD2F|nr:hypothetical protein [Gimesia sp.]MAX38450.1 hypothetical protein [Gimesia sp.]HBL42190.1 hypothetical protein [Planctomycetaceae bacterium]|tara:strand:- start:9691 stop:10989 length:1299 start_codon:yes stop_codon:yes gene_type:complete
MKSHNSQNAEEKFSQAADGHADLWSLALRAAGLAGGLLVCVMVLLGAADPENESEQENRKKIEAMTPAERAQLKRNYEKFQKLSPAEQQRLRELHEATRSQPELNRVMHAYDAWVKTLSPWEQEDLRKADTTRERMELIRKFRTQQQEPDRRRSGRNLFELIKIMDLNFREPRLRFVFWANSPDPETYQKAINIIERSLPEPVQYPKPKAELSEFARSRAVLQAAVRFKKQDEDKNGSAWPGPETVDQIYQLLQDNEYRLRENEDPRGFRGRLRPEEQKRMMVAFYLAKGLWNQLVMSVKQELDAIHPPEDKLQQFFETLDAKKKDHLMRYPPDEMQAKLKYEYLQSHLSEEVRQSIRQRSHEVQRLILDFIPEMDLNNPSDGSRRGGGKGRQLDMKDGPPNGPDGRPGNRLPRRRNGEPGPRPPRQVPPDA